MRRPDLEGVKPGSTIKVNERYGQGFTLHTVQRVTETRAVCEREAFMIHSGLQVGSKTGGRFPTAKYGALVEESDLPRLKEELDIKRRIGITQSRINRATITADNLEAAEAFIAACQNDKEKTK